MSTTGARSQDTETLLERIDCLTSEDVPKSKEFVRDWYKENSDLYDKVVSDVTIYPGSAVCVEIAKRYLGDNVEAKILDVACGSGIVGKELTERGFVNIDGLDPCEDMLKIAGKKNAYTNLFLGYLGQDTPPVCIQNGTLLRDEKVYDMVCVCGGFAPFHIPAEGLLDIAKFAKPGGFIVNVMKVKHLNSEYYKESLFPFIQRMKDKNIFFEIEQRVIDNGKKAADLVVFVFKAQ